MLTWYVKTREGLVRMGKDERGVVSFEYIVVAVAVIGAVTAAFVGGGAGTLQAAMTTGIGKIVAAMP